MKNPLKWFARTDEGSDSSPFPLSAADGSPEQLKLACQIYLLDDWAMANDCKVTHVAPAESGTVRSALYPIIPEYEVTLPPIEYVTARNVLLAGRRMAVIATTGPGTGLFLDNFFGLHGNRIAHFELFAEMAPDFNSAVVQLDPPKRRLAGPHLLFSQIPNYYHWLLEALPLVEFLDRLPPETKLLIPAGLPIQEKSLALLGVTADRLEFIAPTENVNVDELYIFTDQTFTAVGHTVSVSPTASWLVTTSYLSQRGRNFVREGIRQALGINADAPGRDLIYAARDDPRRTVANEPELRAMLEWLGFKTVKPGRLSFEQQVRTFAGARVVVGQTGSNLTSDLFCGAGTSLVEIFVPGGWMLHNGHPEICRGNGMKYSRFLTSTTNVIAVDEFRRFLSDVMR